MNISRSFVQFDNKSDTKTGEKGDMSDLQETKNGNFFVKVAENRLQVASFLPYINSSTSDLQ